MLMFGLHASRPMWGLPDQSLASTAPASQSARVSVAMTAPSSKKRLRFQVAPKFTWRRRVGEMKSKCGSIRRSSGERS